MSETEQQFREELQELLDRYKDQLTNPQIMRIAQPIFTKTIGFKDNSERINIDISRLRCSSQMMAKADCDGNLTKCNRVCLKGEWICTD